MKNAALIGILSLIAVAPNTSIIARNAKASTVEKVDLPAVALKLQDPSAETVVATSSSKNSTDSASDNSGTATSSEAQKTYEAAVAFYDSGKLEEAITAFKRANRLRPDSAQTYYMMGMAYSKAKAFKEAADSFKRAVRYKPDWADAHFKLGMISYVLGRRNQSLDEYKKLLELNSPLANALYRVVKDEVGAVAPAGTGTEIAPVKQLDVLPVSASLKDSPVSSMTESGASGKNETASSRSASQVKNNPGAPTVTSVGSTTPASDDLMLTGVYKVGVGDVLDIRLLNSASNRSTLYTVMDSGVIDFPIAGGAVTVAGLTTVEIQTLIAAELKRRAVAEGAQLSVGVRQYGSHACVITGLVNNPGTKILRREAVPLYSIMAEAQPRPDAGRVAIMRVGTSGQFLDLGDSASLNVVIRPGDVINVTARPQEFYYIAGRIYYPGQKPFQPGITLLQALLAAGGTARPGDNEIEISRDGADGRLNTTKFNLKDIKSGKIQDPRLQPGDRIEVVH